MTIACPADVWSIQNAFKESKEIKLFIFWRDGIHAIEIEKAVKDVSYCIKDTHVMLLILVGKETTYLWDELSIARMQA